MNKIHIALVAQPFDGVLPPYQNSLGIWVYEMAQRLAETYEVTVYMKGLNWRNKDLREGPVRFRQVSMQPDRQLGKVFSRLPRSEDLKQPQFAAVSQYLGYAVQVAMDLRRQGCDLVLLLNFSQFVPVIRAVNPRIKIVLNMRCEWLSQLERSMIASRLAKTDSIVGCSHHITHKVQDAFPEYRDRTATVFNAVDTDRFMSVTQQNSPAVPDSPRLLYVGRVSPEKGVHVLLSAMRTVVDALPTTHLTLVGGQSQLPYEYLVGLSDDPLVADLARFYEGSGRGAYMEQLRHQVQELGLEDHVTFTGLIPYADVLDHFRSATLMVNPSFSESFGRTPVEAMACALPVVGTRVGGMQDTIVDGQTGCLVPAGDAAALAAATLELLPDGQVREKLGRAGRERTVRLFSWDSVATAWRELFEKELAKHG